MKQEQKAVSSKQAAMTRKLLEIKKIHNLIAEVKYTSQPEKYPIGIAVNGVKDIKTSLDFLFSFMMANQLEKDEPNLSF